MQQLDGAMPIAWSNYLPNLATRNQTDATYA
jgi:hypothetical protein